MLVGRLALPHSLSIIRHLGTRSHTTDNYLTPPTSSDTRVHGVHAIPPELYRSFARISPAYRIDRAGIREYRISNIASISSWSHLKKGETKTQLGLPADTRSHYIYIYIYIYVFICLFVYTHM